MGDRNLRTFLHGSTKEIVSLMKSLPERKSILSKLDELEFKNKQHSHSHQHKSLKRFNKHPRNLILENDDIIEELYKCENRKAPSKNIDYDSSDDLCDITIRKSNSSSLENSENNSESSSNEVSSEKNSNLIQEQNNVDQIIKDSYNCANTQQINTTSKVSCNKPIKKFVKPRSSEPMLFYFDRKLQTVTEKSLKTLEEIRYIMERGIDSPDGSEDLLRRHKRATEFSSRFSRIHLYQINLYTDDLEKMLNHTDKNSNVISLNQKFLIANQTVYQALQAYCKHLPTSVAIGVPEKLKELLKAAKNLCSIYEENVGTSKGDQIITEFKNKTNEMAEDIDLILTRAREPIFEKSKKIPKKFQNITRKGKNKKLGMYNNVPIRKDVYWKKAVALLAETKFDVPSRYKTATFKHRQMPISPQAPPKKSIHCNRKHNKTMISARAPVNDMDDVTTMMQEDISNDFEVGRERSTMWNLAKDFFKRVTNEDEVMLTEQYNCILEHFISIAQNKNHEVHLRNEDDGDMEERAKHVLEDRFGSPIDNMDFEDFVKKLLECINTPEDDNTMSASTDVDKEDVKKSEVNPVENYQEIVSVTGVKNAKLICIKDNTPEKDNSDEENNVQPKAQSNKIKSAPASKDKRPKTCSNSKSKIEGKQLKMLPKEEIIRIIDYKLLFNKETRSNCLYQRGEDSSLPTWDIAERIADMLMDEAIASVARDIQVDGILQKIYAKEFK